MGFPAGSAVKNLPADVGNAGLIPGSGRSPGEGNGNPVKYSCLGNPMDRGGYNTVHGAARGSDTTGLNNNNNIHYCYHYIVNTTTTKLFKSSILDMR